MKEYSVGQVSASSSVQINAAPEQVLAAVADYDTVRPAVLTSHYRDYQVVSGGQGEGTVVQWILQATESRSRNVKATVTATPATVTETDSNSSLVTTWTASPAGEGTELTTRTEWTGAGGVKGIFEGIFAPLGLKKIQAGVLENLKQRLEAAK